MGQETNGWRILSNGQSYLIVRRLWHRPPPDAEAIRPSQMSFHLGQWLHKWDAGWTLSTLRAICSQELGVCVTQTTVQQSDSERLHKCLRDAFEREALVAYRLRGAAPGGGGGGGGGAPRPQPPEPPAPPPVVVVDVLRITAIPANFAPSAETCKIDYALTRNSARLGKKVRITIKDRAGVTVYSGAGHDLDGSDRGSFAWDGKGSGGAFVGPLKSPFAVEAAMADDSNVMDKKEVKVELKEVSLTVVAPDNKLLMNDLNAKFEVVALVKIKKTDGSGVATRVPVDVTFTDPPENNTPFRDSFKHAEPDKYLGKSGDPDAVHFEAHASSAASSPDAYKQSIKATTIVAAGAEQGKAKIYFKPSGVGGDGYKLKAAVLDGGTELAAKESPTVTVWRFVAFDAIYEMQGETHVSTNGATAVISPVFDPAFVRYTAGAPISIDAAKSVKYIGLWTSVATPQQSWATVQAKTAAETPTATEIADATYAGADAALLAKRVIARAAIVAKAQVWASRIDAAFATARDKWIVDAGIPANALVAIKHYHPKYSSSGGDSQTAEWRLGGAATPAWLQIGAFPRASGGHYYTGLDPDGLWVNWGGLSHGQGRVTAPTGSSAATMKQVVRHEAGHATKSFFKRDVFGASLDHSVSNAGIMYYTTAGGTTFTDREKKILRGIKP